MRNLFKKLKLTKQSVGSFAMRLIEWGRILTDDIFDGVERVVYALTKP